MENAIFPKRRINSFFSERHCTQKRGITAKIILPSTIGHESFRQHIIRLYGEDTYNRIRYFEKLRTKREKSLCDISFLLRCRDKGIISVSHQLRHSLKTPTAERILHKASLALLRQNISATYRRLDVLSRELYKIHLTLSSEIHAIIFEHVDSITRQRAEHNAFITTIQALRRHRAPRRSRQHQLFNHNIICFTNRFMPHSIWVLFEKEDSFKDKQVKVSTRSGTRDILSNSEAQAKAPR